jgi:hypothetical protein
VKIFVHGKRHAHGWGERGGTCIGGERGRANGEGGMH